MGLSPSRVQAVVGLPSYAVPWDLPHVIAQECPKFKVPWPPGPRNHGPGARATTQIGTLSAVELSQQALPVNLPACS